MKTSTLHTMMTALLATLPAPVVALSLGFVLVEDDDGRTGVAPRMEAHVQVGDEVVPWQDLDIHDTSDAVVESWTALYDLRDDLRARVHGMLLPVESMVTVTREAA